MRSGRGKRPEAPPRASTPTGIRVRASAINIAFIAMNVKGRRRSLTTNFHRGRAVQCLAKVGAAERRSCSKTGPPLAEAAKIERNSAQARDDTDMVPKRQQHPSKPRGSAAVGTAKHKLKKRPTAIMKVAVCSQMITARQIASLSINRGFSGISSHRKLVSRRFALDATDGHSSYHHISRLTDALISPTAL
jgi:hypothetical protein